MKYVDIIIMSSIIMIVIKLLVCSNKTENFSKLADMSESERDTLFLYKEWLKKNEAHLTNIHIDNYIRLFDVKPELIKKQVKPPRNLSGGIDFLEEQNKLITQTFNQNANKIGFITSNEFELNKYTGVDYIDPKIIILDPVKLKKKKLPAPVKTKQI